MASRSFSRNSRISIAFVMATEPRSVGKTPTSKVGQEWVQLGFRIHVLMPGQRNGTYHRERGQEDFLARRRRVRAGDRR